MSRPKPIHNPGGNTKCNDCELRTSNGDKGSPRVVCKKCYMGISSLSWPGCGGMRMARAVRCNGWSLRKSGQSAFYAGIYAFLSELEEGKKFAESLMWFRRGASVGHAECCFHLASMYARGLGIAEVDWSAALFWFKKAVVGGYWETEFLKPFSEATYEVGGE